MNLGSVERDARCCHHQASGDDQRGGTADLGGEELLDKQYVEEIDKMRAKLEEAKPVQDMIKHTSTGSTVMMAAAWVSAGSANYSIGCDRDVKGSGTLAKQVRRYPTTTSFKSGLTPS